MRDSYETMLLHMFSRKLGENKLIFLLLYMAIWLFSNVFAWYIVSNCLFPMGQNFRLRLSIQIYVFPPVDNCLACLNEVQEELLHYPLGRH